MFHGQKEVLIMTGQVAGTRQHTSIGLIKFMIFMMFFMFAMTTDSVGVIIPKIIEEFGLSMTAAGAFHYVTMAAIAIAAILFGYWADKLGHKKSILIGLAMFAVSAYLFIIGSSFAFFIFLLAISGTSIGIFKTGALALIGDVSKSTTDHTSTMNLVEGFFGVGAIVGPAIVVYLLSQNVSWQWLYAIAATLCVILLVATLAIRPPRIEKRSHETVDLKRTFRMMKNPYAIYFSIAAFLYVSVECAVYVWMPMMLKGYTGNWAWLAVYSMSIFFAFRAIGRFMGAWVLARFDWSWVLTIFSGLVALFFVLSVAYGPNVGIYLLPLSGLFMSMIYPTINSKGISCFPKEKHGAISGVILFFTCFSAAVGPLAMGAVSDFGGDITYGFILATVLAVLLFGQMLYNSVVKPTQEHLDRLNASEYGEILQTGGVSE
jgi:fucose permease